MHLKSQKNMFFSVFQLTCSLTSSSSVACSPESHSRPTRHQEACLANQTTTTDQVHSHMPLSFVSPSFYSGVLFLPESERNRRRRTCSSITPRSIFQTLQQWADPLLDIDYFIDRGRRCHAGLSIRGDAAYGRSSIGTDGVDLQQHHRYVHMFQCNRGRPSYFVFFIIVIYVWYVFLEPSSKQWAIASTPLPRSSTTRTTKINWTDSVYITHHQVPCSSWSWLCSG